MKQRAKVFVADAEQFGCIVIGFCAGIRECLQKSELARDCQRDAQRNLSDFERLAKSRR